MQNRPARNMTEKLYDKLQYKNKWYVYRIGLVI